MPTKRPRHLIVQTDQVTRALNQAAQRWPEESSRPGRLLRHLIEEGERALAQDQTASNAGMVDAVARTRGALTGVYGPGYLERLRQDWPQ